MTEHVSQNVTSVDNCKYPSCLNPTVSKQSNLSFTAILLP